MREIAADLAQPYPMHRLLQGDVGSGKTVVAAIAAAQAIAAGAQVALMAPTEILAEQHFRKLAAWLQPLGVNIAWMTGSLTAKARREAAAAVAEGSVQLVVGTQALIQDHVEFHRLGLSIVDEQHRFWRGQRLALTKKGETVRGRIVPHQLNMSATPIPRTLAMTFFADLDVSVIDELPPGRTPVVTKLVSDERREEVIAHIAQAARAGRQAYWVRPLVEESEALELQTAVDTYEGMRADLPDLRIGLVRPPAAGREGGGDAGVPRRRGRPAGGHHRHRGGRGCAQCVDDGDRARRALRPGPAAPAARAGRARHCRIGLRAALSDAAVADRARAPARHVRDIRRLRDRPARPGAARPWEFLGTRQSGMALLRFADLETDAAIAEDARDAAVWLRAEHPDAVQAHLARWMRGREDFLRT